MAASATGTAGVIVFATLPILAGQIAERFVLTDSQTGFISSAYFTIYALISLMAPLWIRRFNWRFVALAGFALLLSGLLLLYSSTTNETVITAMIIAGAGSALLLPISIALVADMQRKERAYGISIAAEQLVPTVLLLGISAAWLGDYELANTALLLTGVVLICLICSFSLPKAGRMPTANSHDPLRQYGGSVWPACFGLVGLAIGFAGFAAMWVFLERVATDSGLQQDFTTRWIGIGLLMTAAGSFFAVALSDRFGRVWPMLLPTVIAVGSVFLLAGKITQFDYAIALMIFPFFYYLSLSYISSVIADADVSGRLSSLMSFALACGALIGPATFGFLRQSVGGTELVLVASFLVLGIVLTLLAHFTSTKTINRPINTSHQHAEVTHD